VVLDCHGIWVGWTGLDDFDEINDHIPESPADDHTPTAGLKSEQTVPVCVDPVLFDLFYNGCCNGTFWPLFHSMPDRAVFNKDHWKVRERDDSESTCLLTAFSS
jgi:trehalose 6-phosphate synthase/phosphatase